MRVFTVPFNIDNEDKIIGGYVSLRQFFWLFIAFLIVLYLFVLNTGYLVKGGSSTGFGISISILYFSLTMRIILALTVVTTSLLLSFLKVKEINLDKYIFMWFKYHLRNHIFKL